MTKKIVCKLTIGGAAITTASLVTSTVLLMTNKNNSCPNDENKWQKEENTSTATNFAQIPIYYFNLASDSLNQNISLCKDENGEDLNINLNFSQIGFTYFWNDSTSFDMMVPKGEFKNLQYCIDQQWVRSDEQYFTLTNNDGINGSFVGSIDFNNKGVSTAAAMLTDIDGYDAIKYTIDTSDVFDEMMSVYLTFETPDGQPYKMADNIMISKPLNYDSLHPIWNMKFNAPFVMKLRIYVNNTGVGNYSKYEIYAHPSLTFVDDFYCGPIVSNLNIARSSDFKISTLPSGLTFDEGSDNISGTLFGYKRIFSRAGRYDQYAGEFPTDACARLLPWKNDGSILTTAIKIQDYGFVAESTLNIASITNVFDTMPTVKSFSTLLGAPNFYSHSETLNTTNSYFLPQNDWSLDYSTMKIYDVSGKLLSGNDFQAYLQQLDITLDYSFDDTLIHDNKNVNAYSCTASEMDWWDGTPKWEQKDYIAINRSQNDEVVLRNVGWNSIYHHDGFSHGEIGPYTEDGCCKSMLVTMTFSQKGINFATSAFYIAQP